VIEIVDPKNVGAIIADLRIMGRLSQRALCAEMHMHQARLSDWETGRAIPTIPYLVKALGVLGYQLAIVPDRRTA